jgi:type I restriction enzyme S subunit
VYSDDTSNYKVVRRGHYGFPSNHIEEGSIGYQDICEAGIVSPIYSVFKTSDDVHDGYLYRLLKTEHYRQIFEASTNASVDRRGSLRWREFSKIRVPLPSLAEQQNISDTIETADAELANIGAQLMKLKTEKRALMQQLLTGKRRVKVAA